MACQSSSRTANQERGFQRSAAKRSLAAEEHDEGEVDYRWNIIGSVDMRARQPAHHTIELSVVLHWMPNLDIHFAMRLGAVGSPEV